MGNTTYGYRIENGRAVIDDEKAAQVRMIYTEYLSGTALCTAAMKAGLSLTHSSVKHLLTNRRYLGDGFYPAIIDEDTYRRVAEMLKTRAQQRGRNIGVHKDYRKPAVPTTFRMEPAEERFTDPFEQAAYRYSMIKEVKDGAGQEHHCHSCAKESGGEDKGRRDIEDKSSSLLPCID